jgi:hypothetical protein
MADFLEVDEIGAPAKAKIGLLSDKLQVLLKISNPKFDTEAVEPLSSRRGRSRGRKRARKSLMQKAKTVKKNTKKKNGTSMIAVP